MGSKADYDKFCARTYVPIYSKSWWLDAVCGSENWDVWLYKSNDEIWAAMPFYMEERGKYRYITKALLSQNNGIIFRYPEGIKYVARQAYEEKIINAACDFIRSLKLDVYEQQYHYKFQNWLPFFWNRYTAVTRYTYVIDDLTNIEEVWRKVSSKERGKVRKGQRNAEIKKGLSPDVFFGEHEKVFLKQGLQCPFTYEQWIRIYTACKQRNSCEIFFAEEKERSRIASVLFLIWDEESAYLLLSGSMPNLQNLDTYSALIWESIQYTASKGLRYDFEGSVIERISKTFREFGGEPKPYFRIRKVFNPEIMREETEKMIRENIFGG